MARLRKANNSRKQGERLKAAAREKWRLNLQRKREPLIPASVLKQLAALNLPNNRWVYDVCLSALMNSPQAITANAPAAAVRATKRYDAAVAGFFGGK